MRIACWTLLWLGSIHAMCLARARADCEAPPFELLWSYPADGEEDVPRDATVWLLTNQGDLTPPVSATLNGHDLAGLTTKSDLRLGQAAFRLPPLQPTTSYTLRVRYGTGFEVGRSFVIRFKSGREPGGRAATAVRAVQERVGTTEHPCMAILGAQHCFDNPEQLISRYTFLVAARNTIAWYVKEEGTEQTRFWPAVCGDPAVLADAHAGARCHYLYGIDVRGELASLTRHCGAALPEPLSVARSAPRYAGPIREVAAAETQAAHPPERQPTQAPAAAPTARDAGSEREGGSGCGGCGAAGAELATAWWAALPWLAVWRRRGSLWLGSARGGRRARKR